ncbi:hypothetical protein Zmor_014436 [Zophobas morio]|uniref:NADH dehydrogenase [ubiquinone] 1 alpha subcomplex subunit 12 n=1 Tax=Zophobas morio TaxID=2755281 RepID=A0AA38IJS3_9CUCU|nr:hypothetical protein Zmor_014436 [Zophobas morio]
MAKYFGIDKVLSVPNIIKENGGLMASLYKLYRMDTLKVGECVGIDKYGNKYYESKRFFLCRNRWVEYAPYYKMEYDGSQIPAEWHGWFHNRTECIPDQEPFRPNYKWMADHTENMTGTVGQYMPYSTTRPKIEPWIPQKKC